MERNPRSLAALVLLCTTLVWADYPGIRARRSADDYPGRVQVPAATIAASALSQDEIRNSFAADLDKDYIVFEVAFYPGSGGGMKISPVDFMLKLKGQGDLIRPAEPAVIARAIQERNEPKQTGRTVDVIPTASIGYESGVYNNGTYNGHQRSGGWVTSVGVGVAVEPGQGPSGPATNRDRGIMEAELFDKSLPEGEITRPTAGYVYFPAPKGKQKHNAAYELKYLGESQTFTLAVPAPHGH